MATQPSPLFTIQQYLDIERAAEFRSEYIDGGMYAMSGGSPNHAVIAMLLGAKLVPQLVGSNCRVAGSDLRVYCKSGPVLTYPDLVVYCNPAKFMDSKKDTLADATVIVEVLSPSTQNYDRSQKFRYYRSLPSFSEYLLLAQDEIRLEHHVRREDGAWVFREFTDPETEIVLDSIHCRFRLGDLYLWVEFESE